MKRVLAGIVGGGFIGKQHIEAVRRVPSAGIVAICERTIELAKGIADSLGIEHFYDSVDKMLKAHPNMDVLHNCAQAICTMR